MMATVFEIRRPDCEFWKDGKPSGHYARGIAINGGANDIQLELLCNGKKVWVLKSDLVKISEDHTTMGFKLDKEPFLPRIDLDAEI